MPVRENPFPFLSYITADGDEIILARQDYKKWWECYGRKGFAAPPIDNITRKYADGETKTLAIQIKPRKLVVNMFIRGTSTQERDNILFAMISRMIQVGSKEEWGKLKIRRSDGSFVYIDCVYVGGFDDIVEEYPNVQKFSLEFYSGTGYFYDADETVLSSSDLTDLVYLADDLYLSNNLYLKDGITSITVNNAGEQFYPIVRIKGPASVIKVTNNTTGLTMEIDPSYKLTSDRTITFDCQEHQRKVLLSSAWNTVDVSYLLTLGSTLVWPIVKGTNNITFYYTDGDSNTQAKISYRQRYYSA